MACKPVSLEVDDPRAERPVRSSVGLNLAVLVLVATASVGWVLALARERLCIWGDAAQYLSVTENLSAGRGLVTNIITWEKQYRFREVPVPYTTHGPGYPLLSAALCLAGPRPASSTFLVAVMSYASISFVLFAIAVQAGLRPGVSLSLACSWYLFVIMWFNVLTCMSEALYILCTLVAAFFMVRGSRSGSPVWAPLAGAAAAVAVATRNAGILFVASVGLYYLDAFLRTRDRRALRDLILAGIAPTIAVIALFGRNYLLTGSHTGGNPEYRHNSFSDVATGYYYGLSELFGFEYRGLKALRPAELLLVSWAACVALWMAFALARRSPGRAAPLHPGIRIAYIYVILGFVGLAYIRMTTWVDLKARILVPLVPFALLILACVGERMSRGRAGRRVVGRALVWAGALVFALGQVNVFEQCNEFQGRYVMKRHELLECLEEPIGGVPLKDFLHARRRPTQPILVHAPEVLFPVLDTAVLDAPGDVYTTRVWDEPELHDLARHFDVEYVLAFPRVIGTSGQDRFFRGLVHNKPPGWLRPVHVSERVVLYEVQ